MNEERAEREVVDIVLTQPKFLYWLTIKMTETRLHIDSYSKISNRYGGKVPGKTMLPKYK